MQAVDRAAAASTTRSARPPAPACVPFESAAHQALLGDVSGPSPSGLPQCVDLSVIRIHLELYHKHSWGI